MAGFESSAYEAFGKFIEWKIAHPEFRVPIFKVSGHRTAGGVDTGGISIWIRIFNGERGIQRIHL